MKKMKNCYLNKLDISNATNHDIELLFVIHWQYKQSICIKKRVSPKPKSKVSPKKKKSPKGNIRTEIGCDPIWDWVLTQ